MVMFSVSPSTLTVPGSFAASTTVCGAVLTFDLAGSVDVHDAARISEYWEARCLVLCWLSPRDDKYGLNYDDATKDATPKMLATTPSYVPSTTPEGSPRDPPSSVQLRV